MSNKDREMLSNCLEAINNNIFINESPTYEFPLDADVAKKLTLLRDALRPGDDDFEIFRYRKHVDSLWKLLIEKAIKCLRFHDSREPFLQNNGEKQPRAYGIESLTEYYDKYTNFERVLYGANKYYRDHVIHVFRTWLSGVELMAKNNGVYLSAIKIQAEESLTLTKPEKLSIWTLIALTHDLGYPLQKAKEIIDTTRAMVSTFLANPDISIDFAFHGVQNYMNDYILRLMSSKMVCKFPSEKEPYVARLQPKYYFKFQKSLEKNEHGILSVLIIYKFLTYFLESDYSINEDYYFTTEEQRQFYIRREILRAIASHTCSDIYQMYLASFSFLLRICDDTQEWGRKRLSELYVKSSQGYILQDIDFSLSKNGKENQCKIQEKIIIAEIKNAQDVDVIDTAAIKQLIGRFRKQSIEYVIVFRDGPDTVKRDFSFKKILEIDCGKGIFLRLIFQVPKGSASTLSAEIQYTSSQEKNRQLGMDFLKKIKHINKIDGREDIRILKGDGTEANTEEPASWRTGAFSINLAHSAEE